jgi:hypothetical protein
VQAFTLKCITRAHRAAHDVTCSWH